MSVPPQQKRITATDRHHAAVSRSLGWAQESAERGDYTDALAWVQAVEATGTQLPPGYRSKCRAWLEALTPRPGKRRAVTSDERGGQGD